MDALEFRKMIVNYVDCYDFNSVCEELQVSIRTVKRWYKGLIVPHTYMRAGIEKALHEMEVGMYTPASSREEVQYTDAEIELM